MTQEYKTVAELLEDPKRWTQREDARAANGNYTYPDSPDAVCWCLYGAMKKIYPDIYAYNAIRDTVIKKLNGGIVFWNDATGRTHEEVLNLCKELGI